MPRNKSEKFPGSPELEAFMRSEALEGGEEAVLERIENFSRNGPLGSEYFALGIPARIQLRNAIRAARGLDARENGLASDPSL